MKKLLILSSIIISFIAGAFIGKKIQAFTSQEIQVADYELAAQKVADALHDELYLQELVTLFNVNKKETEEFIKVAFPHLELSEKELESLQACLNDYQEFIDLLAEIDLKEFKKAWQSIAWEFVDGQWKMTKRSYVAAAKKFASKDAVSMNFVKKYLALESRWGRLVKEMQERAEELTTNQPSELFFPLLTYGATIYSNAKQYQRAQEIFGVVKEATRFEHSKTLFFMALKDRLINTMDVWLPIVAPYLKSGLAGLGDHLQAAGQVAMQAPKKA